MDLKAQSIHCIPQWSIRKFTKFFELKKRGTERIFGFSGRINPPPLLKIEFDKKMLEYEFQSV
jgi:hypothetical protein